MPHAHHFLQRLDRMPRAHAEFALSLYRDEPFLQRLLRGLRTPEGVARVAIAMDDDASGPFVVVTADGHFVTCLGQGMSPRGLPVVTRGQVDAARARELDMESRAETARAVERARGGRENLLRLAYQRADALSRDELIALSAWAPVLYVDFLQAFLRGATRIDDSEVLLRARDRSEPHAIDRLRTYWRTLFANAHHLALATMGDAKAVAEFLAGADFRVWTPTLLLTRERVLAASMRAAWSVSRLGKLLLGPYKRQLAASSPLAVLDAVIALTALAARHQACAAEVRKALRSHLTAPCEPHNAYVRATMLRSAEVVLAAPDTAIRYAIERGQRLAQAGDGGVGAVSDSLAELLAINECRDLVDIEDDHFPCILLVASIARRDAEELYFTSHDLARFPRAWSAGLVLDVLERARPIHRHDPSRNAARTGRNAACVCGSGKKYKRCCGA